MVAREVSDIIQEEWEGTQKTKNITLNGSVEKKRVRRKNWEEVE